MESGRHSRVPKYPHPMSPISASSITGVVICHNLMSHRNVIQVHALFKFPIYLMSFLCSGTSFRIHYTWSPCLLKLFLAVLRLFLF